MKLTVIEKILIFATALMLIAFFYGGKNNPQLTEQATPSNKTESVKPAKPEITVAEAKLELQILSRGLDVRYDNMTEQTYCQINLPDHVLFLVPYVALDKSFGAELGLQIFSISHEPFFFDTLYIKSADKVTQFSTSKYRKSSYNEWLRADIYQSLKEAVDSGYLKFRVTGNGSIAGERELTAKEIADIKAVFSIYDYFSKVKVVN